MPITYVDKETYTPNPLVDKFKLTSADANEIKNVVNAIESATENNTFDFIEANGQATASLGITSIFAYKVTTVTVLSGTVTSMDLTLNGSPYTVGTVISIGDRFEVSVEDPIDYVVNTKFVKQ